LADKAHIAVDKKLAVMEKRISAIYSASYKKSLSKMLEFAKTFDKKAGELLKAVKNAQNEAEKQKAKKAYINYYRKEIIKSKAFKTITAGVALELYNTNIQATNYINAQTPDIYALNFNYINNELAKDIDGFKLLNVTADEVEKYGDLTMQTVSRGKDTRWNEDNIKKAVIVGATLLLGASAIMKRSASMTYGKNKNFANMHASGIATYGENKGRLDGLHWAEDTGNEVTKIWLATLDNRTRHTHARLDGAEISLDDKFDNGLEFPRDPNGEPAEICNCRCTLKYGVGQAKGTVRASRQGTVTGSYKKSSSFKGTKSTEVSNMTYEEWMKWRTRK
jgi:uncharacterized protein with gpF-like domain